jgi:DNA-binding NarL/FixJ family response regulator
MIDIQRNTLDHGRTSELERARAALKAGIGVLVVGERGSGRTRFVRALTAQLDDDTRSRLWVGDDLHHFDDEQARRFTRAVLAGTILPLATVAARRPLAGMLDTLWRDGAVIRVELGPLSANSLLGVAENSLGAPLSPSAIPAFIPARGGADIAALEEALSEARKSGVLVKTGESWRLTGVIPPSDSLRRLLHSRVGLGTEVSELTATVLDLISLTPGMTLVTAVQIAGELRLEGRIDAELERLEEAGVVEIVEGADGLRLRLRDGLIELLLAQTVGVLRRRRLTMAIVDVLLRVPSAELGAGDIVSLARNGLALGRPIDAESLTRAARASLRTTDHALAMQLATAAVRSGGGFDAEMALAAAESQSGLSDAARGRLHRLMGEAEGDLQLGEVLTAVTQLVLERAADSSAATAELQSNANGLVGGPSARLNAIKGFMLFALGDPAGAADLVEPALDVLVGEERARAHFVIASASLHRGRLTRANESLDAAEAILIGMSADVSRVQVLRAHVKVFEGRIDDALATIRAFREAGAAFGDAGAEALCGWAIGGLLLSAGRASSALDELRTAVAVMERIGLSGTLQVARCDLATALAMTGDEEAASVVLESSLGAGPFGSAGKPLQALGWVHACSGRLTDARVAFVRAADAYIAPGHDIASLFALTEAARAGAAGSVLSRIELLGHEMEGPLIATVVRHARALAAGEALPETAQQTRSSLADEFDQIGEAAAAIDVHMIAAEAFAQATALHTSCGDSRRAAASARRRDEQIVECGLERLPLVAQREAHPLSERETEIARLASDGSSNREIAARLVLSVRTVETHLQRVYQKLGVRSRAELPAALRSGA